MSELFYTSGGTLPPDSPSYIERQADRDLEAALGRSEYCYVLTSRQMGKSSLMLRAARRLRTHGAQAVVLDLTSLGQNVTPEQWYFGLLENLGEQLDLEDELQVYWLRREALPPLRRWMAALKDVVLPTLGAATDPGLTIFIDEIDAVRSLPFSTDEFFAAIRQCYNRRGEEPMFRCLTFCLLGVATPSDLIQDVRTTPFNIGTRIELTDFTEAEARPLAAGLVPLPREVSQERTDLRRNWKARRAADLLRRVLYWTGGHPYLTQRLCRDVASRLAERSTRWPLHGGWAGVDAACAALFLSAHGRERDDNLLFVRDRLLRASPDLVASLEFYRQIRTSTSIRVDEANPLLDQLRLSGVLAPAGSGTIVGVRNRIYRRVFDLGWIRRSMPDAEARRLQEAYRRGMFRTAALAGTILLIMFALTGAALDRAGAARMAEQLAHGLNQKLRGSLQAQQRLNTRLAAALTEAERQRQLATTAAGKARQASATARTAQRQEVVLRQTAETRRHEAETARSTAQTSRRLALASLSRNLVGASERAAAAGDLLGALPPLARALELDAGDPAREPLDRIRLGELLRRTPNLLDIWTPGAELRSLAVTRDHRVAAEGSAAGTVRLYDLRRGRQLRSLLHHPGAAGALSFSPDGRWLAVGGDDGTARVWSVATGEAVSPVLKGIASLAHVAWHPNGQRLALAGNDGVMVVEVKTGRQVFGLKLPGAVEAHAVFSPDGKSLALVATQFLGWMLDAETGELRYPLAQCFHGYDPQFNDDGSRLLIAGRFGPNGEGMGARILDTKTGAVVTTLRVPDVGMCAQFSPDGRRVAVGDWKGNTRVLDAQTGEPISPMVRHPNVVGSVDFSPDGRYVVSTSWDGLAQVWSAHSGTLLAPPLRHAAGLAAGAWVSGPADAEIPRVLTASRDGAARLWQLPATTALAVPSPAVPGPKEQVLQQEYGRDALGIARYGAARLKTSAGEEVRVWNTASGQACIPGDPGRWRRFAFAPDGTRLLLAGPQGAQLWDLRRRRPLGALQPIAAADAATLYLSAQSRYLSAADAKGDCRIYDLRSGRLLHSDLPTFNGVREFSADGKRMLVRLRDQSVWIYTVLPAPGAAPNRIRLPLDGQLTSFTVAGGRFIAVTTRPCVRLWDWNGKPRSPEVHPASIAYFPGEDGLSISPDRRRALLLDRHSPGGRAWSTATLLDLAGRVPPRQLGSGSLPGFATSVFSPDGSRMVLLGQNGQAQVWDAATARPLSPLLLHGRGLYSAALSADGRRVAIGSHEGTVSVWDIRSGKLVTPILSHPGAVDGLEFSTDGRLLLSHSNEGTARVWDARTGEALALPLDVGGAVDECRFAARSDAVLALSHSRLIRRELVQEQRSVAHLTYLCTLLAAHRSDANGGLQPLNPREIERSNVGITPQRVKSPKVMSGARVVGTRMVGTR